MIATYLPLIDAGILNRDFALRMLEKHRLQWADHHMRLWTLLNLETWHLPTNERQYRGDVHAWMHGYPGADHDRRAVGP